MIIRVLTLGLILQLGLVAWLYWPTAAPAPSALTLIAAIEASAVDRVVITTADAPGVVLTRDGTTWSSNSGLPVDRSKLQTLFAALFASDPGFAIARSDTAATRFNVAADNHERKVTLSTGDTEATVFLGSSPAFRKIHARAAGSNAVYVIELNSFDAPTTESEWLDRSLVAIEGVDRVVLNGSTFELREQTWFRNDDEILEKSAMEGLINTLAGLRVSGLVADDDPQAPMANIELTLTAGADNQDRLLSLFKNSDAERFYLKRDDYDELFNISAYDAEKLRAAAETASPDNGTRTKD